MAYRGHKLAHIAMRRFDLAGQFRPLDNETAQDVLVLHFALRCQ
jgi:hypothetical protein